MRLLPILLLLVAPLRASAIGPAWPISDTPRFWILGEGLGHFAFDVSYFQTRENYDEFGVAQIPGTLDRLHYTRGVFHGGYGFAPKLSLFAQAAVHSLQMNNPEAVSETAPSGSNLGLGDAFLAFRWLAWRSSHTDRVYPSEWAPDSWVTVLEGSWAFPLYDRAEPAKPPLGDQSNDFTGMARLAWYTNEWLAFSGGAGYMKRTAGYTNVIPWTVRADFSLQEQHKFRFWVDFLAYERNREYFTTFNSSQPDTLPNGSRLFKSQSPTIRSGEVGAGYLISKDWELVGGLMFTASGVNHAKGWGGSIGVTWRPYQVPEIKYDEYRKRQIERLQTEKREFRRREVVKYGFRSTIVKVSAQGNYVKILYGERDRVRVGDTFYILLPDTLTSFARRPIAFATVVQVQPEAAYLHVDERYGSPPRPVQEGCEARRVYFENDED